MKLLERKSISHYFCCLAVALFFVSSIASADISLTLAEDVVLLAENGKAINKKHSPVKNNNIKLKNGINQILVHYNAEVEVDRELRYEKTDTFVIVFDSQNEALTLSVPVIESIRALEKFNKKPTWKLLDKQGQTVETKIAVLKKDGVQFRRDYAQELQEFNQSDSIAAVKQLAVQKNTVASAAVLSAAPTSAPISTPAATPPTVSALEKTKKVSIYTLMYWYEQASPEVQEQFKKLINE